MVVNHGYGFVGHRRVTLKSKPRAASKGKTRGRTFHAWSANDGSVRRKFAKASQTQRDHAAALHTTLREERCAIVNGATVVLETSPRERVIVFASDQLERMGDAVFTLDSFVKRAALA